MADLSLTERQVALISDFHTLVEKAALTPMEMRALICGIVVGFAASSGVGLDELHDDIDAAYEYRLTHPPGRPS